LPVVYEQTISGFYIEAEEYKPNIINHPINHERRLRKAYEKLGMDGVRGYLETIIKLQRQRHENFVEKRDGDSGREADSNVHTGNSISAQEEGKVDSTELDKKQKSRRTKKGD
jgi:hypothetical protein